ncbi:MAG TPA: YdaU family protein [Pseudomonadales bacterium]|nr:YdaU family protein [Pseudomonadales bacterium]
MSRPNGVPSLSCRRFFQLGSVEKVSYMHYYKFNIADYRKDTGHLSTIEHGIYRQLIDWYYLDEKPIPLETQVVMRRLRLGSQHQTELQNVLDDFFVKSDGGYTQGRIDAEIEDYQSQADKNRTNGKLGGRPKKTQSVISGNPDESENNPNHKPVTNKPLTHKPNSNATRGSRLPANWKPDDELVAWSKAERPDLDLRKVFAEFKDYWTSIPGSKGVRLDWSATWRNWVRKQTAVKQSYAQQAADVARQTVPAPANQDAALKQIIADRENCTPPPAHIREMMKGILGVKNA